MANSLQSEPIRGLLDRLFKAAEGDGLRRVRVAMAHPDGFGPTSLREQADAYEEIYIPVSPEAGRLLYSLIRAARPATVAEFATIDTPVEFVLLDGWKNLYLPVLHLLEPRLTPGALVIADDTISLAAEMGDYLGYIRDPANGYLSVLFPDADGLEITCRA